MTSKKIAVSDIGEFWYGNYKEPFVQLEGAVPGYPEGVVLIEDKDGVPGDKLLCAYCGKTFHALAVHARLTHGMSAVEYKDAVGLLQKSALVSETERLRRVKRGLLLGRDREHMRKMLLAPGAHRARDPRHRFNRTSPEALNKRGRCYTQSLEVARAIVAAGHPLTFPALHKKGIDRRAVLRNFGDLDKLARLVNGKRAELCKRGSAIYTREQLLGMLRSLAHDLGRTPSASDLKRYGFPSTPTFRKFFGTYTEACHAAGLPDNAPTYKFQGEDAATLLTAYSILGNVGKVAEVLNSNHTTVQASLNRYGIATNGPRKGGPKGGFNPIWLAQQKELAAQIARRLSGVANG